MALSIRNPLLLAASCSCRSRVAKKYTTITGKNENSPQTLPAVNAVCGASTQRNAARQRKPCIPLQCMWLSHAPNATLYSPWHSGKGETVGTGNRAVVVTDWGCEVWTTQEKHPRISLGQWTVSYSWLWWWLHDSMHASKPRRIHPKKWTLL